ncbi:hypothetical protein [Herbidospora sp. RD11066]
MWTLAILISAIAYTTVLPFDTGIHLCVWRGPEPQGPAADVLAAVFPILALTLPLLLIFLAARPRPLRAWIGAGAALATAVAYGISFEVLYVYCASGSQGPEVVLPAYGIVALLVVMGGRRSGLRG